MGFGKKVQLNNELVGDSSGDAICSAVGGWCLLLKIRKRTRAYKGYNNKKGNVHKAVSIFKNLLSIINKTV